MSISGRRGVEIIYKLITNDWILSDLESRRSWQKCASLLLVTFVSSLYQPCALSNPIGGSVVAGSAVITRTAPNRLDIAQNSTRAVIDWRSFSIDSGELTHFQQPSASSIALNRVRGSESSFINGSLTANGRIVLINQNGVLFGHGSNINVGSLIATTSDIRNIDFMSGNYQFDIASEQAAAGIVNLGQINVDDGGAVILSASQVTNEGQIKARLGHVILAGTETFAIDFHGDGLLQFDLGRALQPPSHATDSESLDTPVVNHGSIIADGGIVTMTAHVADSLIDRVINMDGVIRVRAVDVQGGTIILSGGSKGVVAVSGTLDASGLNAGQIGGEVSVLGDKVGLYEGADIDVSGDIGAGQSLIGGNYQGRGPEYNAKRTLVEEGAFIHADALSEGNGGKIIVWSHEVTGFYGTVSARGGAVGGDGGFVEVSGKQYLDFDGEVLVNAEQGQSGTLLLDPLDLTIVDNVGADDDQIGLIQDITDTTLSGEGVLFIQGTGGNVADNFTLNAATLENLDGNVVVQANRNLSVDAELNFSNQTDGEMVTLQAGDNLTVNESISTNGADLHLEADSPHSAGGADDQGRLTIAADISSGGDLTLIGADFGFIPVAGSLSIGGDDIAITSSSGGSIDIITVFLNNTQVPIDADLLTVGEALTGGSIGLGTDAQLLLADSIQIAGFTGNFSNVQTLRLVADDIIQFTQSNVFTGVEFLGVEASQVLLGLGSMTSCDCLIEFFDFDSFVVNGGEIVAPFIGFTSTFDIVLGDSTNADLPTLNTDSLFFSAPSIIVDGFNPAGFVDTVNLFSSNLVSVQGGASLFDKLLVTSPQFIATQGGTLSSTESNIIVDDFTVDGGASIQADNFIGIEGLSNSSISLGDFNPAPGSGFNISNQELAAIDTPELIIRSTLDGGTVVADNVTAGSFDRVELNGEAGVIFQGRPSQFPELEVNSSTASINADINTNGDFTLNTASTISADVTTAGGDVDINGNSLLRSDINITTNGGAINFNANIDGANNLTLSAGSTGNILFGGDVGLGDPLRVLNINSAQNITYVASLIASDISATYSGAFVAGPNGFLAADSLFVDPNANSATLRGEVAGAAGDDAALTVDGPSKRS